MRKSLVSALVGAWWKILLIAAGTMLFAAWMSVNETWDERILRDRHTAAVRRAAFSPDGRLLVSVGEDKQVIVWDFERRERLRTFNDHTDWIASVAFSPDGKWFATASYDKTVIVWDAARLEKAAVLRGHQEKVCAVAFSPDGRLLVSSDPASEPAEDDTVLWRVGNWEKIGGIPYSRWLVSAHGDGAVLVWDMVERERRASFNDHSGLVNAVTFARDGKRIASASANQSVIIWDAATGRKETTLVGHTTRVTGLAFAPGGDWLASVDRDGKVVVWDLAQRQPLLKFKNLQQRTDTHCLAVSPDGRWVVASHGVYENATGHQVVGFHDYNAGGWRISAGHIYSVSFSVDGRWMAFAEAQGRLFLWDTTSWQVADRAAIAPAQLISVSFSPDGQWLATGEDQGIVRLWSARPLRQVAELGRHTARVKSVAFSPDGQQVVSASDDKTICLCDVGGRKLITRIGTHTSPVLAVAFSPDGKQIVSGERDHSVRLYTRRRALWGWRLD